MTLAQAKKSLIEKIGKVSHTPALDADVLLQNLLGKDKTFVLLNKDFELSAEQAQRLDEWAALRAGGLPVAYIIGKKEFYGYEFFVDENVLIPKPDTEILVERALDSINGLAHLSVCDMCSGSGCVGISILRALVDQKGVPLNSLPQFTLVDISAAALEVGKKNASRLLYGGELGHINFIQSDLFESVPQKFDVIVSNPPYIPHKEVVALLSDGRREPALALDGDVLQNGTPSGTSDGLALMRRLALEAKEHLVPNGILLMEAGEYNICEAADFLRGNGYEGVEIFNDLEGQKRVVAAQLRGLR